MGSVFKKTFTKPLPANAEILEKDGERFARWKPAKGRIRMAPVTTGNEGTERILIKAATYTAKYRDGQGRVVERPTGCRDETAARSILAKLEKRAELVKARVLTADQDEVADHQATPLKEHLQAYLNHQTAKALNCSRISSTKHRVQTIARDCKFECLSDFNAARLEEWLTVQQGDGMSAANTNELPTYLGRTRGKTGGVPDES